MIKKAEFIKSVVDFREALIDLESVLLLGRSNVGKSSFINAVTNRKSLARVSQTPGKTITLNYYLINQNIYLVDAPGYGYARRSKGQKEEFVSMIDNFIKKMVFKYIFLLIDFKVGPTKEDQEVYQYLSSFNHQVILICTKKDKVKRSEQVKRLKEIKSVLNDPKMLYVCSSETKEGIAEITNLLVE
ncbi:ribosome biogenesis GTP-binding protein YihA/YsxC [Acholeplasma sp. OttesenSCG-928-E16]|nr:ribosome biogenesis GTP-binding protein YihA/YsxC [Acholeplasma sp. OttesenSCG-928-E16]